MKAFVIKALKTKYRASYTIEASFLLPMILSVIVLLIYMAYYFHDRAVISAAAYTAALRGSQLINDENVNDVTVKSAEALIKERLLATRNVSSKVNVAGETVSVTCEGDFYIPAGAIICRFINSGRNHLSIKVRRQAKSQNPAKLIRQCRALKNLMGKENG